MRSLPETVAMNAEPSPTLCDVCGCPPREWLRLHVVAKHLGKSTSTLRRWCERGLVLARKVGRAWEVQHWGISGLDAFLQSDHCGQREARELRAVHDAIADNLAEAAGHYAALGDRPELEGRLARLPKQRRGALDVHVAELQRHAAEIRNLLDA